MAANVEKFKSFANGLLNEQNKVVAEIMDKMHEVRSVQQQMAGREGGAWEERSEADRGDIGDRLAADERTLKYMVPLCNEMVAMLHYLTSDEEIRRPFLLPVILPRVAATLVSVLVQLVVKGLSVKVNNPEQYQFDPKRLLREMLEILLHFGDEPAFHQCVGECGFYQENPGVLARAAATCRRHRILPEPLVVRLDSLVGAVAAVAAAAEAENAGEMPERFLDEIM